MSKKHAIIKDDGFIFYSESKGLISIKSSMPRYSAMLGALLSDDFDESEFLKTLAHLAATNVEAVSDGKMKVTTDNTVEASVDDEILVLPGDIQSRVRDLIRSGASYAHLENFWRRCLKNPNRGSVEQLYAFLTNNNLTITDDGYFLAYKAVNSDFTDIHSGTYDNHPGKVVEMPRDAVTFDPGIACSAGLHVSTLSYAQGYGGVSSIKLVVKVDPADVVSVPFDYDFQKIRTCRYEVISVWESDEECPHAVVDAELSPVTSDPAELDTDREWSGTELASLSAALKTHQGDLSELIRAYASRLSRTYDSVAEMCDKLMAPPWVRVGSRKIHCEARHTLYDMVQQYGHCWEYIAEHIVLVHPELENVSVDTLRKVSNRMGI